MGRKPLPPRDQDRPITSVTYDDLGRIFVQEYKNNWWKRFSMVRERWFPLQKMEADDNDHNKEN